MKIWRLQLACAALALGMVSTPACMGPVLMPVDPDAAPPESDPETGGTGGPTAPPDGAFGFGNDAFQCGGMSQVCCGGRGQPCQAGLNCDTPMGSAAGTCVDTCGGMGQPCCGGGSGCAMGLGCIVDATGGTCGTCGGPDQPCCGRGNGTCTTGMRLVCGGRAAGTSGSCTACGGSGQPCCGTGNNGNCTGGGLICTGRGMGSPGTCGPRSDAGVARDAGRG